FVLPIIGLAEERPDRDIGSVRYRYEGKRSLDAGIVCSAAVFGLPLSYRKIGIARDHDKSRVVQQRRKRAQSVVNPAKAKPLLGVLAKLADSDRMDGLLNFCQSCDDAFYLCVHGDSDWLDFRVKHAQRSRWDSP